MLAGVRLRPARRGLRPRRGRRRAHRARRDRGRRRGRTNVDGRLRDRRRHRQADAGPRRRGDGHRRRRDDRRRRDHGDRLRHDPAGDVLPAADRARSATPRRRPRRRGTTSRPRRSRSRPTARRRASARRVGFVKIVADAEHNEILGAHLIGPDVTELLPALTLAQQWDLTADEVARNVFAHPTLSRGDEGSRPRHRRPHDQLLMAIARSARTTSSSSAAARAATSPRWSPPSSAPRSPSSTPTASAAPRCSPTACPSKTLIATAELMTDVAGAAELGVNFHDHEGDAATTHPRRPGPGQRPGQAARRRPVRRHRAAGWTRRASRVVRGRGRLDGPDRVVVTLRGRRRGGAARPTPSWSPPAPRRARCRPPSPTASGSSPGSRSTTSTEVPDEADRGRLRRHRRRVRQRLPRARHRRHPGLLAATGCCPARTPTPPRCSRRCSPAAA